MTATTAELLTALWPVFAAVFGGFAVGVYVWANTKRDSREALTQSAAAVEAADAALAEQQHVAGKIAGLELSIHREIAAIESRVVALETRQADILQAVLYIKDHMLVRQKSGYKRGGSSED